MKKHLLFTLGVVLLPVLASAKGLPEFSSVIEQTVATQVMSFANERVKQMCQEWPTCEQWARKNIQQNPSFRVVDAEVERWIKGWEGNRTIWEYRFHVQTFENENVKAYVFRQNKDQYLPPMLCKKFPEHPVPQHPSQHIYQELTKNEQKALGNEWPGYTKWLRLLADFRAYFSRAVTTQYIYKYDENSNALWKRGLYVEILLSRTNIRSVNYFEAYQTHAGGGYTYETDRSVKACPTEPSFR